MGDVLTGTVISVRGKRLIPTQKYGNEEWEFTVSRQLDDDEVIGQELYVLWEMVKDMLDQSEVVALEHVNPR